MFLGVLGRLVNFNITWIFLLRRFVFPDDLFVSFDYINELKQLLDVWSDFLDIFQVIPSLPINLSYTCVIDWHFECTVKYYSPFLFEVNILMFSEMINILILILNIFQLYWVSKNLRVNYIFICVCIHSQKSILSDVFVLRLESLNNSNVLIYCKEV